MTNPATRRKKGKRSAASIGKDGEREAAKYFHPIDPTCKRIKRYDYGVSDKDLTLIDVGACFLLGEVKTDKAKWSRTYEGLLEQPAEYAERQRETKPVIPFLLMQLRQGKGRPWKRQTILEGDMFRDLIQAFLEREQYIKKLEGDADRMAEAGQTFRRYSEVVSLPKCDPSEVFVVRVNSNIPGRSVGISFAELHQFVEALDTYLETRGD